jgi:hypothetical protein
VYVLIYYPYNEGQNVNNVRTLTLSSRTAILFATIGILFVLLASSTSERQEHDLDKRLQASATVYAVVRHFTSRDKTDLIRVTQEDRNQPVLYLPACADYEDIIRRCEPEVVCEKAYDVDLKRCHDEIAEWANLLMLSGNSLND